MRMCDHVLVWVVYDSVQNAVFEGQVLAPLRAALDRGQYRHAVLVTFENNMLPADLVRRLHEDIRLQIVILKKYPFMGMFFLWIGVWQLRRILAQYSFYDVIARGALAGFIAQRAIKPHCCKKLIIQARGLLAEEYRYAHMHARIATRGIHWWRTRLYAHLEKAVYGSPFRKVEWHIEVVTNALQNYLEKMCGTPAGRCLMAQADIPDRVAPSQVVQWRNWMRTEFKITREQIVYCFCGSVQPWQCPEMIVQYFVERYMVDSRSFLLILTPDVSAFLKLLQKRLPSYTYLVIRVCHEHIYQYLAIADIGVIFRQEDVVSWVARPVKAMEYEAVGLRIVHNNTVAWLIERTGRCSY